MRDNDVTPRPQRWSFDLYILWKVEDKPEIKREIKEKKNSRCIESYTLCVPTLGIEEFVSSTYDIFHINENINFDTSIIDNKFRRQNLIICVIDSNFMFFEGVLNLMLSNKSGIQFYNAYKNGI